jgi:hypothetical protein
LPKTVHYRITPQESNHISQLDARIVRKANTGPLPALAIMGLQTGNCACLLECGMNIQFVRLEDDVCEPINVRALEQRRTVSDLVNEIVRKHLAREEETAGSSETH